jgi:GNAT superfamily N-acetyltransferase
MSPIDLYEVSRLADLIHPDYHEKIEVLAEKLVLYPAGCFVLENNDGSLSGYALSHPWRLGPPPKLNQLMGGLPARTDTFYIHDIALDESVRGFGAARRIVDAIAGHARREGFSSLSLTAISSARDYWRRSGFAEHHDPEITAALREYDPDAVLMVHELL